jgi:YHS domain-containing protein
VKCEWCKKEVNRSPSALKRVANVFCSKECKNSFEEMRREALRELEESERLFMELERFGE